MSFDFLFEIFGYVLSFLYDLVPSYGFTVIGLTVIVMIVVTPLTLKATRSMLMMQQLQPQMKKIQSQYKDDRQKLNEELLKFYKENNINPVGGCLPLLIQTPVFIVLYNVLRGLTLRDTTMGSNVGAVSGQLGIGQTPSKPPAVLHTFDPQYLPSGSKLGEALTHTTQMKSFGIDLAESFTEALSRSLVAALPLLILIIIVGITGFVQQRQIQGRTPTSQMTPQQQQTQQIMKIMPIFLPVISLTLQSGLVLYFAVSNLYRVGMQWFITRNIYGPHHAGQKKDGDKADKGGDAKGGAKGSGPKGGGSKGDAKPAPAKPAGGGGLRGLAARVAEDAQAKANEKQSSGKAGAKGAKGQPAKARTGAPQRSGGGGKAASSGNRPTKASGRATPPKKKPGATSNGSGSSPAPTLQPRARKKKR